MKNLFALLPAFALLASAHPYFDFRSLKDVTPSHVDPSDNDVSFEHLVKNTTTPGIDSLPSCAVPCIQIAVKSASTCQLDDLPCLCKQRAKIAQSAKKCILSTCGAKKTLKKVRPQVQAMCKEEDRKEAEKRKAEKKKLKEQEKARKKAEKEQKERDKAQREAEKKKEKEEKKKQKEKEKEEKKKKKEEAKKKKEEQKEFEKHQKEEEKRLKEEEKKRKKQKEEEEKNGGQSEKRGETDEMCEAEEMKKAEHICEHGELCKHGELCGHGEMGEIEERGEMKKEPTFTLEKVKAAHTWWKIDKEHPVKGEPF
ncbi:hypothetical protein N5P37_000136 [Trichoderma harzianum]|nr:hypothetical protein N5P37_000136 [Trichoderma harzianum]